MGKRAILLSLLIGLGCHASGDGSQGGSGGTTPPTFGGAGGTTVIGPSGGTSTGGAPGSVGPGGGPGGGGPTGGAPGAAGDAGAAMSVDAGSCPFTMAGKACAPAGATCSWSGDCVSRRCDCVAGTWACSERQMPCGGMCPVPQDARCGDSCTGSASNCLCHCGGGGPNYSGCSCTGGRWQCSCGR